MKRLRDMNNKELEKVNRITLIIALICEIGVMIKNIIWYDDYNNLAMIIMSSFVIAGCIYVLIDQFKRYKRIKKRKDEFDKKVTKFK